MAHNFVDRHAEVATALYGAVFDAAGWGNAMGAVRGMLGADHAALGFFDTNAKELKLLHGDCPPEFEKLFVEMIGSNPLVPQMLAMPAGRTLVDEHVIERSALERTAFFNLWLRPQRQHSIIILKVLTRGGIDSYAMFNRGELNNKFNAEDAAALEALGGTLTHALNMHTLMGGRMREQTGHMMDERGIGWVAVDSNGRVIWSNPAAEILLGSAGSAVSLRLGRLSLDRAQQTRRLVEAVHRASHENPLLRRGADMAASNSETGRMVVLSVVPADNLFVQGLPALRGAYIAIQDLSQRLAPGFEERIRDVFALTPREAQLAAALASGHSLGEAAAQRGITISTARSQLAQVFRKTGTVQQSQLVALLLSIIPAPALR